MVLVGRRLTCESGVVVGAKGQTRGCWGLLMLRVIRGGCDGVKNEERFVRSLTNDVRRTSWSCRKPVRFRNGNVTQEMNEGEEKGHETEHMRSAHKGWQRFSNYDFSRCSSSIS